MAAQASPAYVLLQTGMDPFNSNYEDPEGRLAFTMLRTYPISSYDLRGKPHGLPNILVSWVLNDHTSTLDLK
ncbi:hypothetical protein PM082_006063 [Marasmius tenuissimus]|nr:hypothetical protein PM082_006063 [Marasmius tenuissimus]